MPTYPTPTPIDLAINLPVGAIDVVAGDRTDTVVTVSPTNPAKAVDRRGAEETKVDFDGQRLTVTGPEAPRSAGSARPSRSTCGSSCRPAHGSPPRSLDRRRAHRRPPRRHPDQVLDGSGGHRHHRRPVAARRARQRDRRAPSTAGAEITADHGQIRVGTVTGDAILKASHGSVRVGESGGDARRQALLRRPRDHAGARLGRPRRPPTARIALDEVSSGSIQVESGYGQVTIGVRRRCPRLARPVLAGRARAQPARGRPRPRRVRAVRRRAGPHPVRQHHRPARPMSRRPAEGNDP